MESVIQASVGLNGKNNRNDILIVQEVLGHYANINPLLQSVTVDGVIGPKTNKAIAAFQKYMVLMTLPDSRIDKGGKTEKTLLAGLEKTVIQKIVTKYGAKLTTRQAGPKIINYRRQARRELSQYSEFIIKLAMHYADLSKIDISSTRRTPEDQARAMYDNCISYNVSSVEELGRRRGWRYGKPGRKVEKVFFANKDKPRSTVIELMKTKIESMMDEGKTVSRHCVKFSSYKHRNVLDIPYSGFPSNKKEQFEKVLMSMSKKVKGHIRPAKLASHELIAYLILEGRCFHIEILQGNKLLPNIL